jgi:hypothetical protein
MFSYTPTPDIESGALGLIWNGWGRWGADLFILFRIRERQKLAVFTPSGSPKILNMGPQTELTILFFHISSSSQLTPDLGFIGLQKLATNRNSAL